MIRVRVRYKPPNLAQAISDLPRSVRGIATEAAADYIIGTGKHGLKHYPAYKHIRRVRAYPDISYVTSTGKRVVGYRSAKQHRYVMAMIKKGRIDPGVPHRTGIIQRGWKKKGSGAKVTIINEERGVDFVHDDRKQARLNALVGWRKTSVIIASNERGAIQAAQRAVEKYLRDKVK